MHRQLPRLRPPRDITAYQKAPQAFGDEPPLSLAAAAKVEMAFLAIVVVSTVDKAPHIKENKSLTRESSKEQFWILRTFFGTFDLAPWSFL